VPAVVLLFVLFAALSAFSVAFDFPIWAIVLYTVPVLIMFCSIFMFKLRTDLPATFQCPFVPFVPCLGVYINMFLIVSLSPASWARVFIWTILGMVIYFAYGIRYSRQGEHERSKADAASNFSVGSTGTIQSEQQAATLYGTLY
jgi:hypothetical protein